LILKQPVSRQHTQQSCEPLEKMLRRVIGEELRRAAPPKIRRLSAVFIEGHPGRIEQKRSRSFDMP
jgi:hypothetical protein